MLLKLRLLSPSEAAISIAAFSRLGMLHIDLKYLPQMPDETRRPCLSAAIDRASRLVYVEVLNDNGTEFTDHFCATGKRITTGTHIVDTVCDQHGIEHRLTTPRHPQTNGMIERFNGRISDILTTRPLVSIALRA